MPISDGIEPVKPTNGCVAKPGNGFVEVVIVLTHQTHRHPVHEHLAPVQMASFSIEHYLVVRPVVPALSPELPQLERDDAGEGSDGKPHNGVSRSFRLMLPNWTSDAELT